MAYLFWQVLLLVVITAVLWFAIGWWLRSIGQEQSHKRTEAEWSNRIEQLTRDRDAYRRQAEKHSADGPAAAQGSATRIAQMSARINQLEGEVNAARDRFSELGTKAESLAGKAKQRDREIRDLCARTEDQAGLIRQREETIVRLEGELARAPRDEALSEAPEPDAGLEQALADARSEITQLKEIIREQELSLAARREAPARADGESLKQLNAALAQQRRESQQVDEQLKTTRRKLASTQQGLQDLTDQIARRDVTIEQLKKLRQVERSKSRRPDSDPAQERSGDLFAMRPAMLSERPEGKPDDLKRIRGIGPVLEQKLNALGVFHYRQVAAMGEEDINWLASHLRTFPKRIVRDRWIEQADALAAADG